MFAKAAVLTAFLIFMVCAHHANAQDVPPADCSNMATCQTWCAGHHKAEHRPRLGNEHPDGRRKYALCDQVDADFYKTHGMPKHIENYVAPAPHQ